MQILDHPEPSTRLEARSQSETLNDGPHGWCDATTAPSSIYHQLPNSLDSLAGNNPRQASG